MMTKIKKDHIVVRNARQHNLKGIDLEIPRNKLVVITGPSGSGKSSLAFDTIYAEGQRRYVESLSTYARQFLNLMEKPDVDRIDGLSPAVAIQQRRASGTPRSTVGTVTEIYDYLRLLFAKAGKPYCPNCTRPIIKQTLQEIIDWVLDLPKRQRLQILAPMVENKKGIHLNILEQLRKEGYVRVRIDGQVHSLDDKILLDRHRFHSIDAIVDRLVVGPNIAIRLADSLETTLALTGGIVTLDLLDAGEKSFSTNFSCKDCGIGFNNPEPRLFSFNSPNGACPTCAGVGTSFEIDLEKIVPDPTRSVLEGAVVPLGRPKGKQMGQQLESLSKKFKFDLSTPFNSIPKLAQKEILWGTNREKSKIKGIIPALLNRYQQASRKESRLKFEAFMTQRPCSICSGNRLKPEALAIKIEGLNIAEICDVSISEAISFFHLFGSKSSSKIVTPLIQEIRSRLIFLENVGVGYLPLNRNTSTLSGGELQRIRLATQVGSNLVGVLYVLDEPSIGLHPRDNRRLIETLCQLRDLGNTILVVEHDRETIMTADYLIDLGPEAGDKGGHIVAQGTLSEIMESEHSLTGSYLSGRKKILPTPKSRIPKGHLILKGAQGHNLKSINIDIPLSNFVCITGVSGSGKSTLINETLYPALAQKLHGAAQKPLEYASLKGLEKIDKVIRIDQSLLGRTPRSNPATYTGLFKTIRDLFSQLPEAKVRGYSSSRFSFNTKGGRCEVCQGDGVRRIEMHFLPDIYITCEACHGLRYNRETLEIHYKGNSIADALGMTVSKALTFFRDIPQAHRKLLTLSDVGLGYICLGQSATNLSGGESQRVKLATELSKISTGNTLYILDEPTTGLHLEDIRILLNILDRLVDNGNTIIIIEHNIDVIKRADWIVDLGPEGGDKGGTVVASGTPKGIAQTPSSFTGQFLKEVLFHDSH